MKTSSPRSIPKLREDLSGRVIAPDDPGYDEARTVFLGGIDRRPAVIARVANAADVSRVVSLARETGWSSRCEVADTASIASPRKESSSISRT